MKNIFDGEHMYAFSALFTSIQILSFGLCVYLNPLYISRVDWGAFWLILGIDIVAIFKIYTDQTLATKEDGS